MSRALVRVLSYVYQAKVNVRIRKHRISKRVNEIIKQLKKAAICLNTNADREREREKTLTSKTHIIIIHGNCGILIEKIFVGATHIWLIRSASPLSFEFILFMVPQFY